MKRNKYEIDMCNGSIMDKLISFSLPLMLSSILQLMFNAVDIIVVGRFSGSQALAAVGSTTALINIFTNLFIGISLGANVLAAHYYAAGRDKEMSEAVHTAITLALISGIIMAFVGAGASRLALELMDTPGMLWPRFDDPQVGLHLACIGAIRDEILSPEELALELLRLLSDLRPGILKERYQIDEDGDLPRMLEEIAKNRNCVKKGNVPDLGRAAALLLDEFRGGRLGSITLEIPESKGA